MQLNNKSIVITGGTSGIGFQLVNKLSSSNQLFVIAKNQAKLTSLSEEIPNVTSIQADLSIPAEVVKASNTLTQLTNNIDLLINNAAIQHPETFLAKSFQYESIAKEVTVNFASICQLTYLLLPLLLNANSSIIVNVNSGLALAPKTTSAVYCATKAALNSFSQSLSYQLANTNICVQQAFLPLVETNMTQGRGQGKISAVQAADQIIKGVQQGLNKNYIGKVKLLNILLRLFPAFAHNMMRKY